MHARVFGEGGFRGRTQAQPAVLSFLVSAPGDHHAVDDVTQEVAVALLKQAQN